MAGMSFTGYGYGIMSLCLGSTLFVSSCSTEEIAKTQNPPVLVGKISKVFQDQKFVLIQQEKIVPIPNKDTVLLSQGKSGERLSNLVVSAERLAGSAHFPADIRSGYPALGDFVFLYESIADGQKGVSVLVPSEDGSVTKPEEIKFPALEEPEKELSDKELDAILKDSEKMPE